MLFGILVLFLSVAGKTSRFTLEASSSGIKLYNNDTISVDISGWELHREGNDDHSNGWTYVFPHGTVIPARGFIIIPMDKAINGLEKCKILRLEDLKIRRKDKKRLQKTPLIHRLYSWFNPAIETENNLTQPNAQTKVVGGTANQKFVGPLTIGLGGKYVKKLDNSKTYLGLTNLRLQLNKLGNLGIHHQHLLKGKEIREHPEKTILTWNIPTIFGLALSLNREHRWSDEFKADFSSVRVERTIGNNTAFYTRYSLQSFGSEFQANQTMTGARNTINLTKKLKLITFAELWRNGETHELYYRTFNSAIEYFSSELSRFSIGAYTHVRNYEYNPIVRLTILLPVKFNLYLGTRAELNYHIPRVRDNWYCLKRCTGIAYIPRYTNKFRIVGNITESESPWETYRMTEAFKIIVYPIHKVRTSLKWTYSDEGSLGSAWVKYLHRYFEVGVGGRALHNNHITNYGLSVEGRIKKFSKFSFVCGYRVGYNIIGIQNRLVDCHYQNRSYYVKVNLSENSFESLFEEE